MNFPARHLVLPEIAARYTSVRNASLAFSVALSAEDCALQSMPDASPVKWHLAHTTWFFETFTLERFAKAHKPFRAGFRDFYNSSYNAIGEQIPRAQRGLVSRPNLADVYAYRAHTDTAMKLLLAQTLPAEAAEMVELGLHHEQQHQELILTDLKHLLSLNPFAPAYRTGLPGPSIPARPISWTRIEGGLTEIGHEPGGFAFDNESPRHRQFIEPFELASRPVTNAEYLSFVLDGGYRKPALWLSDGWQTVTAQRWEHPIYWRPVGDDWQEFTLHGLRALDPSRPVVHICHFEADAYARWAGCRLPTEFEWEAAASGHPVEGHFVESGALHPKASGEGALAALFGDVWEWTSSSYAPYPGFKIVPGAVGEYNGNFMANQYVLRGGSCVTPASHMRATYRNFYPSSARWQFAGIRLARDID